MTQVCLPGCLPCCTAMFRQQPLALDRAFHAHFTIFFFTLKWEVELRGLQSAITMLDAPKCYVLILSFTASTVVAVL